MTESKRRVRVRALAKINLTLRVLGIRPDGFHELRTTFQSLALHDTLTFTTTHEPFRIVSNNPLVPLDESNLVWAASERLWMALDRPGELSGVTVEIVKRIPAQAGLGGGSADAAAALRALSALWRVRPDQCQFRSIAQSLGADVPYFLEGGTVLGVDRGDTLFRLADRPPSWVVLVFPGFGVSTKDAYEWWDQGSIQASENEEDPHSMETMNDLQGAVEERHPEIGRLVSRLERLGALNAAMSGSGSALFGLFKSERTAREAAKAITGRRQTAVVTRAVDRRRYRGLVRPY